MAVDMSKECLWYCFSGVLQADCNAVKDHWNTHYIRGSRHNTVRGRPDSLFFLPEYHRAANNLLASVIHNETEYVSEHIVLEQESNEYQEYFDYVIQSLGIESPTTWKEALELYLKLIPIAENGYSN